MWIVVLLGIALVAASIFLYLGAPIFARRVGYVAGVVCLIGGSKVGMASGGEGMAATFVFGLMGFVLGTFLTMMLYPGQTQDPTAPAAPLPPPAPQDAAARRAAEKAAAQARQEHLRAQAIAQSYAEAAGEARVKAFQRNLALGCLALAALVAWASGFFDSKEVPPAVSPTPASARPAAQTSPPAPPAKSKSPVAPKPAAAAPAKPSAQPSRAPADCQGRILETAEDRVRCGGRKMWTE